MLAAAKEFIAVYGIGNALYSVKFPRNALCLKNISVACTAQKCCFVGGNRCSTDSDCCAKQCSNMEKIFINAFAKSFHCWWFFTAVQS